MEKFRDREKTTDLAKLFLSLKKFSSHKRITSEVEMNLLTKKNYRGF